MNIATFNVLSESKAIALLTSCCAAERWVKTLVQQRPYRHRVAFFEAAELLWQTMGETDYLEAFSAHPQIGDINTLREKFANTQALAANEQAAVNTADEQTLAALAEKNRVYLTRYGFIFIVFATGKSAKKMLGLLEERLGNTHEEELQIAAAEQFKITHLRLQQLFEND